MQKGAPDALWRPQFVILSTKSGTALREGGLEDFLRLVPDARIITTQIPGQVPKKEDMTQPGIAASLQADKVVLWNWAGHFAASLAGTRIVGTFAEDAALPGAPLLYDPASNQFVPIAAGVTVDPDSRFADGVRTWSTEDTATQNPSLMSDGAAALIGLSKHTRILIPDSSFIAVETPSQWRMMEEKEKQKLMNKQVFEFEENPAAVPEPATWVLLVVGVALLAWNQRGKANQV